MVAPSLRGSRSPDRLVALASTILLGPLVFWIAWNVLDFGPALGLPELGFWGIVLATVTPTFGGGVIQGQMTYYETPEGAKVFASGTLGFGGSDNPVAARLFENLWQHLAVP